MKAHRILRVTSEIICFQWKLESAKLAPTSYFRIPFLRDGKLERSPSRLVSETRKDVLGNRNLNSLTLLLTLNIIFHSLGSKCDDGHIIVNELPSVRNDNEILRHTFSFSTLGGV